MGDRTNILVGFLAVALLSAVLSLMRGSGSEVDLGTGRRKWHTKVHGTHTMHNRRGGLPGVTSQPARAGTHVSGRTEVYQHRLDNPKCRDAKMHVIFSTICEAYGDWMSEGLVYSHHVTGMKGTITRINSCSNPNYTYPKMWHECYAMHNLPDKSGKVSTFNKAFAIQDFFERGDGARLARDALVVMMDTDMILLQRLDDPSLADARLIAEVTHGKPLAMLYQLGAGWIEREKAVMERVGHPATIDVPTALKHFQIGAPHFMTVGDWRRAAPRWSEYALALWDKYKPNFPWDADMFAFNMALLSLDIMHTQTHTLMVSDPNAQAGSEGWGALGLGDDLSRRYLNLPVPSPMPQSYVPRNEGQVPIIHFCQFISIPIDGDEGPREKGEHLGGYSFGKYDYKSGFSFADVGARLLKCPPEASDIYLASPTLAEEMWRSWESEGRQHFHTYVEGTPRTWHPHFGGHRKTLPGGLKDRRRVFLVREITLWLKAAMRHYRLEACGGGAHASGTSAMQVHGGVRPSSGSANKVDVRRRVAVAVTVVEDGPQGDGAMVLAQSVKLLYPPNHPTFKLDLIAIVSPKVRLMIPILTKAGFAVMERQVPVKAEELQDPTYRSKAPTSGCCGLDELLKLEAWTLPQYEKVLLLDMDAIMLHSVDELWNKDVEIVFTKTGGNTNEGLQGGMIMVRPNMHSYQEILAVIRKGDFRYNGKGWEGSGIGYSYGGETIQGVLPFYYQVKAPPGSFEQVDHCVWNNMGDSPRCLATDIQDVKVFHFTVCQKPWYCIAGRDVCMQAQRFWWETRNKLERAMDIAPTVMCTEKYAYKEIDFQAQAPSLYVRVKHGCQNHPGGCAKFR